MQDRKRDPGAKRVLAISSQVVVGAVGLNVAAPVLACFGHQVLAMPTLFLSSHAGVPGVAGRRIDVAHLAAILDALDAAGELGALDAILTGYLPTAEHVALAAGAIDRVRRQARAVTVLVDPILGDHPKGLYIDPNAAAAIRDTLVARADILKPNAFELGWLSGRLIETLRDALIAARAHFPSQTVLVSSLRLGDHDIGTALVSNDTSLLAQVVRHPHAPHGTGDLLTASFLGAWLHGQSHAGALAHAVGTVDAAIRMTGNGRDLALRQLLSNLDAVKPAAVETI